MAYAVLTKRKRLSNPGRRKRKMSAKQIAIFGTKRQKAALKAGRRRKHSNPRRLKRRKLVRHDAAYKVYRSFHKKKAKRKKNVGSILVATIPGLNLGRKRRKGMAKRRRKNRSRRRNPGVRRHRRHYARRRRNPGSRTRTIVKYRTRGRRHRHHNRRRNPGMGMGGDISAVLGVVAGATVNSMAMGFVPASFATGVPGYIASAVIAVLQGQVIGKLLKKPAFGKQMTIGGLTYTAIKVINDFFPTLSLGLHGLGAISPSGGFFSPQVNRWGSMGTYQPSNTLLNAIAAANVAKAGVSGLRGLETSPSARRVGRIQ